MEHQSILEAMRWRYATKKFDPDKKVREEQVNNLLEAINLTPASFGLQTYRFVVVRDLALRMRLREAAFGQSQITDASHLIVFAVQKNIDKATVSSYVRHAAQVRGITEDSLLGYRNYVMQFINSKNPSERKEWAVRQAYIALGTLITTAALEKIDVSPMEGFVPSKFDNILELDAKGLESVVVAAIGFRSESDEYAQIQKVRLSLEEMVVEI